MNAQEIANGLGRSSRSGGGFVAPCPAHNDRNPSLSISETKEGKILVKCHAGCSNDAVVSALKGKGLWPEPERKDLPKPKAKKKILAEYDYVDPDTGEVVMQVVRYEPKDFRQRRPNGNGGWDWSVPASKRILFNLPAVKASNKLVCVVEGEKDVQGLAAIGVVATCNPGGAGKWQDNYSAALAGRDVCILPDNDQPGEQHAEVVARALYGVARSIRIVRLPDLPAKGDVSDWLRAGGDRDALARHYKSAGDYAPAARDPEPDRSTDEQPAVDTPFRCLGFNRGTYYYLALGTQQLTALNASGHSAANLLGLAPLNYWEREFPGRSGFNVSVATNSMMRQCEKAGIFTPEMLRGRGAWWDDGRIVLHLGSMLYVDRTPTSPVAVQSRFVYERGEPMHADIDNPMTQPEAQEFLDLVRMMPWERDIDALYVAGWCVLAHIGGVLPWRPHVWVVGSKGSGKSHVMSQVIRPILGDNCVFVQGETTEAGIRQTLHYDALPVLFDEAEGEDTRATDRLQRILALVRQSSSETGGRIAKGTANGIAMSFQVRSCFAFSSINASLVQQSDRSRVTVVELKPEKRKHNLDELLAAEARVLTEQNIHRFYSRAIAMAPVIRANALIFAKAVAAVMGEQRAGDQLGALLAGAWSLTSDEAVTFEQATAWVDAQDWGEQRDEVQGQSDEAALLSFLMQQVMRLPTDHGVRELTVGELVMMARGPDYSVSEGANKALLRSGIKIDGDGVIISNSADGIKRLLAKTPWSVNWGKVLRRLPNARTCGVTYFGYPKSESRAVWVPLDS